MALAAAEAARAAGEGELDELPLPSPRRSSAKAEPAPNEAAAAAAPAQEPAPNRDAASSDGEDDPQESAASSEDPSGSADIPEKLYYRIGEVAQLVGVDSHVLRYWESEFRMKPHRSASGQRLYRKDDLSQFLRIRHLLHDEGYTIAGARRVLAGDSSTESSIDPAQIKAAISQIQELRGRILEMRDEIELDL